MKRLVHRILHPPSEFWSIAAIWWWTKRLFFTLAGLFIIKVAIRAIKAAWDNDGFPEALALKLELLPLIFPVHMMTGGLALLIVPLAICLHHTPYHKWVARLASVDVLVAGITAIPVALTQPITLMAATGFSAQAILWIVLLAKGIRHIKRHEVHLHQRAMMMMAAVTSGAVFFRIWLALWAIYGTHKGFKIFYACDAWFAWFIPLLATTLWLNFRSTTRQLKPNY